jgi:hypothetical protein
VVYFYLQPPSHAALPESTQSPGPVHNTIAQTDDHSYHKAQEPVASTVAQGDDQPTSPAPELTCSPGPVPNTVAQADDHGYHKAQEQVMMQDVSDPSIIL